jgi:hypothetical protein
MSHRPLAAVLLSVGAHALVLLGLSFWRTEVRERSLSIETAVLADPEAMHLGLAGSDEERSFDIRVVEPVQPPPAASTPAPVVSPPAQPLANSGPPAPAASGPTPNPGHAGGTGPGSSFFPARLQARSVVFVVDWSVSMGLHGLLDRARRELFACLDQLAPPARFQVILYNRTAEPLRLLGSQQLAPISAGVREEVRRIVHETPASGGTSTVAALRRGLAFRPEVLFLVTDGDDVQPADLRAIVAANPHGTIIHTIELGSTPSAESPLAQLARVSHGTHRFVTVGGQH